MPNWCDNELGVRGNAKDIKLFKERAKQGGKDISLSAFLPMPKELYSVSVPIRIVSQRQYDSAVKKRSDSDMGLPITRRLSEAYKRDYGANNWYDWAIRNWGTKWDADGELLTNKKDRLSYTFMTAWSPPIYWLISVSEMYPNLSFKLYADEEAGFFKGYVDIKGGKIIKDAIKQS